MIRLLATLIAVTLALPLGCALADDGVSSTYTYNYDYWGEMRESPDAYRVDQVIYSATLGLETSMRRPQSLYVSGNDLYVCDTGNNRILQLRREGKDFSLVRVIDRVALVIKDKQSSPVKMIAENGVLEFECTTIFGHAQDECLCEGNGDGLRIGFNDRYFMDALKAANEDRLKISMNTPSSPIIIEAAENGNYLYMVLPVRLREND